MALPKIAVPKYQLTIPSSKKKVLFRPFLMKEQKILLMALEGRNNSDILRAICDIIVNCVEDIDNIDQMPMFDIEYIFAQIRSKSIGENVDVRVKCPKCDTKNDITVQLDGIEVVFPEEMSNKIMINENLGIILKYPSMSDRKADLSSIKTEDAFDFICNSIEMVFDENTTYGRKDFTTEEIKDFVNSMNAEQFEKISKFYQNLPHLNKEIDCICINCKKDFKVEFKGLQDFFT
jgi:hypothetical protein